MTAVQDYSGKEASDVQNGTDTAGLLSGGEREKSDHLIRVTGTPKREAYHDRLRVLLPIAPVQRAISATTELSTALENLRGLFLLYAFVIIMFIEKQNKKRRLYHN